VNVPAVAFVSSHARRGGSERYLRLLLRELEPEWICGVVCLEDGPLIEDLRGDGVEPHVIEVGPRMRDVARAGLQLRRLIRRLRADVVHANGFKAAVACGLDPAPWRPPLIWVKHDFTGDGFQASALALRCRRIVCVSNAVGERFPRALRGRLRIIHNGLPPIKADRSAGRQLLLGALGAPEADVIVGLVGRLDRDKGQHELAAILPGVIERCPRLHVAFIGPDNPRRPDYVRAVRETLVRDGVEDAVSFLGYREDARELMAGCDLVVIPSGRGERGLGREGFGFVGLEAFAVGTPVVGYADGALNEILGECAVLVPPGDRDALAGAIVRVLDDRSLRARLVQCGRSRVNGRFSLDQMVAGLKDEYQAAAKTRVGREWR
jgi:glycosyltransferase involved in cell wall biosynthesis